MSSLFFFLCVFAIFAGFGLCHSRPIPRGVMNSSLFVAWSFHTLPTIVLHGPLAGAPLSTLVLLRCSGPFRGTQNSSSSKSPFSHGRHGTRVAGARLLLLRLGRTVPSRYRVVSQSIEPGPFSAACCQWCTGWLVLSLCGSKPGAPFTPGNQVDLPGTLVC